MASKFASELAYKIRLFEWRDSHFSIQDMAKLIDEALKKARIAQ